MYLGRIGVHSLNTVSSKHILDTKTSFSENLTYTVLKNPKIQKIIHFFYLLPLWKKGYILHSAAVAILSLFTSNIDVPVINTKKNLLSWQPQVENNNLIIIENENK